MVWNGSSLSALVCLPCLANYGELLGRKKSPDTALVPEKN